MSKLIDYINESLKAKGSSIETVNHRTSKYNVITLYPKLKDLKVVENITVNEAPSLTIELVEIIKDEYLNKMNIKKTNRFSFKVNGIFTNLNDIQELVDDLDENDKKQSLRIVASEFRKKSIIIDKISNLKDIISTYKKTVKAIRLKSNTKLEQTYKQKAIKLEKYCAEKYMFELQNFVDFD